jgi:prepilin-type N-terminal cleavage/methylation domain-containing protein/prepilin-type processing-associated H-X9-DG protein
MDRRRGYTLMETVVSIAIIAVLFGLLFCAVMQSRASAARSECAHHLRQIGIALHLYHEGHSAFPPGCSYEGGDSPQPFMSWSARILPFLEQSSLWDQALEAYAQQPNFTLPPHPIATVLSFYGCPADPRSFSPGNHAGLSVGLTSYLGNEGTNQFRRNGVLYLDSHVRLEDVKDGTTNTLLVGERPPSPDDAFGWWYAGLGQNVNGSADSVLGVRERNYSPLTPTCSVGPYHYTPGQLGNVCDTFHFWSLHPGGANWLLVDGSVRFLPYSADSILPALATRAGGETVTLPD